MIITTINNEENNVQEQISSKPPYIFLYYFQRLNLGKIALLLDDNRTYQNFDKSDFLNKLSVAFDEFILAGDTYLNRHQGFCNSKTCNYKSKGYAFIGNVSSKYFELIVEIKDGVVSDLYQCHSFKCNDKGIIKKGIVLINDAPF